MKKLIEYLLVVISIIFIVVIILPHFLNSGLRGFYNPEIKELKLKEWDFLVRNEEVCFSYLYPLKSGAVIFVNGERITETKTRNLCIDVRNSSRIKIMIENRSVSFFVVRKDFNCKKREWKIKLQTPKIVHQYEGFNIEVNITHGECKGRVYELKIYLDGSLLKKIPIKLMPNEEKVIKEKVRINEKGEHTIRVEIGKVSEKRKIVVIPRFELKVPIFGLPFLVFFLFFILKRKNGLEKAFATILTILTLIPLFFSLINIKFFIPSLIVGTLIMVILCGIEKFSS